MLVIKGKGKAGYLTGSILVPPATAATYGVWEAENSTIMGWLIKSMELRIGKTYLFYKNSKRNLGFSTEDVVEPRKLLSML